MGQRKRIIFCKNSKKLNFFSKNGSSFLFCKNFNFLKTIHERWKIIFVFRRFVFFSSQSVQILEASIYNKRIKYLKQALKA